MDLLKNVHAKAASRCRHIVLPEGTDKRIIAAAATVTQKKIAQITLLGPVQEIKAIAAFEGIDLTGINLLDPVCSPFFDIFATEYARLRAQKGVTLEEAKKMMKSPLYFAVMMVHMDICSGMVAGAEHPTSQVLRPALQIIKTKPCISIASGAFIMITPHKELGDEGRFVFADCAVNPAPTAEQLAEIAYCSVLTAKDIADIKQPKVAIISFSSKGSAKHESIDKIHEAVRIAHEKYPQMVIDGELQIDAAIIPEIGQYKAPDSPVAGKANVLIFPTLETGNAVYKAVQRLGNAEAIGPILQGMYKPVNDLSRGCSVDDIVNTVAVVCCQR